jgi:hypothetical protein
VHRFELHYRETFGEQDRLDENWSSSVLLIWTSNSASKPAVHVEPSLPASSLGPNKERYKSELRSVEAWNTLFRGLIASEDSPSEGAIDLLASRIDGRRLDSKFGVTPLKKRVKLDVSSPALKANYEVSMQEIASQLGDDPQTVLSNVALEWKILARNLATLKEMVIGCLEVQRKLSTVTTDEFSDVDFEIARLSNLIGIIPDDLGHTTMFQLIQGLATEVAEATLRSLPAGLLGAGLLKASIFAAPSGGVTVASLKLLEDQIKGLEEQLQDKAVPIGVTTFNSQSFTKAWLAANAGAPGAYIYFMDAHSMLNLAMEDASSNAEVLFSQQSATKSGYGTSEEALVGSSFKIELPVIFGRDSATNRMSADSRVLPAMKVPDSWDPEDGYNGGRHRFEREIKEVKATMLRGVANHMLGIGLLSWPSSVSAPPNLSWTSLPSGSRPNFETWSGEKVLGNTVGD